MGQMSLRERKRESVYVFERERGRKRERETRANKRRPIFVPVVGLDTKQGMNGQVRPKKAAAVVTIQIRKKAKSVV